MIHGYHAAERFVDAQFGRVLDEFDRLLRAPGSRLIQSGSLECVLRIAGKVEVDGGLIVVRLGMARERRRQRFLCAGLAGQLAPDIHGGPLAGILEFVSDRTQFREL